MAKAPRPLFRSLVRTILIATAFMAAAAISPIRADQPLYHFIDLGSLGNGGTVPFAINNAGKIVGYSTAADGKMRAFRTAAYAPINPLTDDFTASFCTTSYATDINNLGAVVGRYNGITAYVFTSTKTDLTSSLGINLDPTAINDSGKIVGVYQTGGHQRAFLYSGGTNYIDLGSFGGSLTQPWDIDSQGHIVGSSEDNQDPNHVHAFRTQPYAPINTGTDSLPSGGGAGENAYAINANGVVVGQAYFADWTIHPVLWQNGVMTDLAPNGPSARALGINKSSTVVGFIYPPSGQSDGRAFVWDGSVKFDLNDCTVTNGMTLITARSINDSGNIVGYGKTNGAAGGFLLRPIQVASLSLSPSKVAGSLPATGTVKLNYPAPQDLVVNLSDGHTAASCPATVSIPMGSISATFPIATTAVASDTAGLFRASYGGISKAATLTVMPISVKSVVASPSSFVGCKSSKATVTLEAVAAPGDITVNLSSGNTSLVTVPASVVVLKGQTNASFTITTMPVAAITAVSITATANGRSKTGTVKLKPIPPKSITLNPISVKGGATSTAVVTLECPAGPNDITVSLSSSHAAATVPAQVVVLKGNTTASVTVNTFKVAAITKATISATANGVTKTAVLTIVP